MTRSVWYGAVFVFLFAASVFGTSLTEIQYVTNDLGSGQWEYIYTVENIGLSGGIEEFTIWFDYALYNNISIETAEPLNSQWDQLILPPWRGQVEKIAMGSDDCIFPSGL